MKIKLKNILISTVLLIILSSFLYSQNQVELPTDDTQIWNEIQVTHSFSNKIDGFVNGSFRVGRNITHLVDERIGGGFTFKPSKFISVTPSYLYIAQRPLKNIKRYENRFVFAINFSKNVRKILLADRNQFERRFLNSRKNTWRYRNRIQIERNFITNNFKYSLYFSNEISYDSATKGWTRNRALVGFTHRFNQKLLLDIFGGRQFDGRSRPGNWNIVGSILRINF